MKKAKKEKVKPLDGESVAGAEAFRQMSSGLWSLGSEEAEEAWFNALQDPVFKGGLVYDAETGISTFAGLELEGESHLEGVGSSAYVGVIQLTSHDMLVILKKVGEYYPGVAKLAAEGLLKGLYEFLEKNECKPQGQKKKRA